MPKDETSVRSPLIFVCDHASNALPPEYGALGLSREAFARHIAYDIGAADVTVALAARFSAPAILGQYSRLLVDLNRGPDDPTLVMKLSDRAIIPGNARADAAEVAKRMRLYYQPYHDRIKAEIARVQGAGQAPVLISIHSFTPDWRGWMRPWHVGILWSEKDQRLARFMLARLARESDLRVGDNEPYSGELEGDCMSQHAVAHGLAHVLIELRQDLVDTAEKAQKWAARLGPVLQEALEVLDLQPLARR
ncbi:MAG: N-formylglutamate amidohydrolase [Alphaproteobacteria bacterium]|nr:N-formylglutamate amidohydrolase [Alphaproteobacteria bacterium]